MARQDSLALKETEDCQVFRGHLVHQVLQELEVQVLLVHQVYLEREEKKVMRESLEAPTLDHLGEQVHQVPKESQDHLVPQEYLTATQNVVVVLPVLQDFRGSEDLLEKQDREVKKERHVSIVSLMETLSQDPQGFQVLLEIQVHLVCLDL